jgi:hypothetical protein
MPLQNRVTPFGEIVATAERGGFIGNRGIIHDPATKTLTKCWSLKAWLVCVLAFQNRRREVMARRSWTELFFLDEATALAAGHRPCFHCRRADANRFRAAFAGDDPRLPRAPQMDAILHGERLSGREKRLHPVAGSWRDLPDGTMIASGGASYLVLNGAARPWSFAGYGAEAALGDDVRLITPPATVRALRAGYRPALHPSAWNTAS